MIYIQSNKEKTIPHHFDCCCALYGAIDSCMDYRLVTFDEISTGKYDHLIRTNLFVGSTEFMRHIYNRIGLNEVRLPKNSNRKCEIITLQDAHKKVETGNKLFIKPVEIKLFTGLLLDGINYSCLNSLPPDTPVMAYEPIYGIVSEWRIYVHNNKIVDSRNYSGSFMTSPDYAYADSVIDENRNEFPCSYTIDIGILNSGVNVVIEFNDMWAIGNYGVPNDIYLRMLKDRYFEIMRK